MKILKTLVIGIIGGVLFFYLSLPLPWILGPMALSSTFAILGGKVKTPEIFHKTAIATIGISLGSTFRPEILGQITTWFLSISILIIFLLIISIVIIYVLNKVGYNSATSFFSALPAGLTESTIIGSAYGGQTLTIALTHTVRVVMIAFTIPFTVMLLTDIQKPENFILSSNHFKIYEYIILITGGILGLWLGKVMKLPAGAFVGPLFISALIHIISITEAEPPYYILAIAQVILGTKIGSRFSGIDFVKTKKAFLIAILITFGSILFSFITAYIFGNLFKINPILLLLAITPGGVTEMSLIALALNQDVAFVTTHHIVRISLLLLVAPLIYSFFIKFLKKNLTTKSLE